MILVVVDLRGSGYSDPALCPDLADTVDAIMALNLSLEEARRRDREAVLACRNTLQDAGIDLGSYNAPAMAADIEDLRQALGYEQWNLFGVSYGTLIAQAVMHAIDQPWGVSIGEVTVRATGDHYLL